MSKKQGFSLVEALIITLVVSGAVAASLPALTTKIQENDKSLSALGVKDARFWKRTKVTGDNIYYNGSVGVFVSNDFMKEDSNTLNYGKTLVLGQKTGTTSSNLSAITTYGKYGYGQEPPTGEGTRFIWSSKYGAFRAGYASGTQFDPANLGQNSFAFGRDNIASGAFSSVYSGYQNTASGTSSSVYAGSSNIASGSHSEIFAGKNNAVYDPYSQIYGGENNTIENCTVSGDGDNPTTRNIIAGGSGNTITKNANYAMIIAGKNAVVNEPYVASIGQVDKNMEDLITNTSASIHTIDSGSNHINCPSVWNANDLIQNSKTHFFNEFTGSSIDKMKVQDEDGYDIPSSYYMTFIFDNNKYLLVNHNGITQSYFTPSDKRLKKDFKDFKYGLNEILELKPVTFEYKNKELPGRVEGFIAQDIKKIYPETVQKDDKGFYQLKNSLLYEKIKLSLVAATKELAQKITALEKDNDKMTDEVKEMKIRLEKMEKMKSNA